MAQGCHGTPITLEWLQCVSTEGLYSQQREGLILYPNCCSLERWVASLACVWSCFSAGSPVPDSVHSPSSALELKSLSHPIPSLLSSGTVCIQLIADALNPKIHRENFVSGSSFMPVCWWGSCEAGGELPAPSFLPFGCSGSPDYGLIRLVSFPTAGGDVKYQTSVDWIRDCLKERNLRLCQIKLHTSPFSPFHFSAASFSAQINLISPLSTNETAIMGQEWLC